MGHDYDEDYHRMQSVAVEVEHIEECDDHDGYFMIVGDDETESRFYAAVTAMHKRGELAGTLKQMKRTAKAVLDDCGLECAAHERMAAE